MSLDPGTMLFMKHLRPGLLEEALTTLSQERTLKLIRSLTVPSSEKRNLYQRAWESQKYDVMKELSHEYTVQGEFHFMRELFQAFREQDKYNLLPLPAFSTDRETFQTLVEKLMKTDFKRGYIKRFGQLTEQHGTVFINNIFFLTRIYPREEFNFDQLLNLDHSKALKRNEASAMSLNLSDIRKHYSLNRIFNLLINANHNHIVDIGMMLFYRTDKEAILEQLPRKPKSFEEIHNRISELTLRVKKFNRKLNQEIEYLDGLTLLDYTIEVPKESFDLVGTSAELRHCVHGYDDKVISKQCQILNLIQDGKRRYTIELIPIGQYFHIQQFRGERNESSMEGPRGEPYKRALRNLLKLREGNTDKKDL